jgi:chromosome segregation ATPase
VLGAAGSSSSSDGDAIGRLETKVKALEAALTASRTKQAASEQELAALGRACTEDAARRESLVARWNGQLKSEQTELEQLQQIHDLLETSLTRLVPKNAQRAD